VWVVTDRQIDPAASQIQEQGIGAERFISKDLPARTADNLFWLGRYVSRAEWMIHVKRAYELRLADNARGETPLLRRLAKFQEDQGFDPASHLPPELKEVIRSATNCAGRVRDRLSPDGWIAVDELNRAVRAVPNLRPSVGAAFQFNALLRYVTGFTGLVHENMYRTLAWRFLRIGLDLERAMATASLLAELTDPEAPAGSLEFVLECTDSVVSYRRFYAFALSRETVLEFVGFDIGNPRSLRFILDEIREQVKALPDAEKHGRFSQPYSRILKISTDFALQDPWMLKSEGLHELHGLLAEFSDVLAHTYMS
jgi:uncharacterized alpha-E superfamily protein